MAALERRALGEEPPAAGPGRATVQTAEVLERARSEPDRASPDVGRERIHAKMDALERRGPTDGHRTLFESQINRAPTERETALETKLAKLTPRPAAEAAPESRQRPPDRPADRPSTGQTPSEVDSPPGPTRADHSTEPLSRPPEERAAVPDRMPDDLRPSAAVPPERTPAHKPTFPLYARASFDAELRHGADQNPGSWSDPASGPSSDYPDDRPDRSTEAVREPAAQVDATPSDGTRHESPSRKPDGSPWPETPLSVMKPLPRLDDSKIGRGESGLIESVDGKSARDYLHTLTDERTQGYRDARVDGTIPKSAVSPVTSTLLDRRTGLLYEAVNRGDRVPTDLHPVLQERLDGLRAAAKENPHAYRYRDGTTGGFPHFSTAGTHAEVHNASRALFDRAALGHETTSASLSEMIVDNRFPYRPNDKSAAPCCANCTAILGGDGGVESIPGKLTNG